MINQHNDQPKENPYAAPGASLVNSTISEDVLLAEPNSLSAGAAWIWIKNAWIIFKEYPMLWIGMIIVYFILSMIPLVNMFVSLLSTVFIAGFILGAHDIVNDKPLRFGHLFEGFNNNFGKLLVLTLLYFIAFVVAIAPGVLILMFGANITSSILILIGALLLLSGFFIVLLACWFAPALVAIHSIKPIEAMKLSLKGGKRNIGPLLLLGLISFGLAILAAIPLGLGLLVFIPVMFITYYTSYRAVFTDEG